MNVSWRYVGHHKACVKCHILLSRLTSTWTSTAVRSTFLDFFCQKHDHLYVPSSSVIPKKGQGTYFTNAGMNQFKPIFLDTLDADSPMFHYKRAANSQKCVRVGGKHNDLDDVGKDLTHHTFFEMLGSWSFGDYFKADACKMALQLLTEEYRLSADRLYFTYFSGFEPLGLQPDYETREIWCQLGVPVNRILPFGMKDNFWDMGETGPCGPCTEIHYDHCGGREASHLVNSDHPEVVEIWNLVFMQYNRDTLESLLPLPRCHVDTGMGLERVTSILQNSISNYETDLFSPLFRQIHKLGSCPPYSGKVGKADNNGVDTAYRIIADHIRMISVCIADGLLPDKSNLGHKLRSVLYRCLHQSAVLGMKSGSLSSLVDPVVECLGNAHPELQKSASSIKQVIQNCEEGYQNTILGCEKMFVKFLNKRGTNGPLQDDEVLALLEGHHGNNFTPEIIEILAKSYRMTLDSERLQKILSQRSSTKTKQTVPIKKKIYPALLSRLILENVPKTEDGDKHAYLNSQEKYNFNTTLPSKLLTIVKDNNLIGRAEVGEKCELILDKTCFYAESGGQVSDTGLIQSQTGTFRVKDVQKINSYCIHSGVVEQGFMTLGESVTMEIDQDRRMGCMRNHTATHLLNRSLRKIVGVDVQQKGSCIQHDVFTFDFSSMKAVDNELLFKIEEDVNLAIHSSFPVCREILTFQQALSNEEIVMLPNEIYPGTVNVVSIREHSRKIWSSELCGGTHVHKTSDIGQFIIIGLSGQTIKRVTCLTGPLAQQALKKGEALNKLYTDLEKDYKELNALSSWLERIKQMRQIITTENLHKITRQEMSSKIEVLNDRLVTKLNAVKVDELRQEISKKMKSSTSEELLLISFPTDIKPVITAKALYDLELKSYLAVVTKYNEAVLCFPKTQEKWFNQELKTLPAEVRVKSVKAKKSTDNSIVTVKVPTTHASKNLEQILQKLCKVQNDDRTRE